MRAAFHDFALMHHAYLVGIADCRQPVGNDESGAVFHQPVKSLLHQTLALGVESRCGLVENQQRRILEYRARDAYALALSARQPASAVADIGVVALLGLHNEVVGVGNARRLFHLFARGAVDAEGYVVVETVVKQYRLLIDVAHQCAQILDAELADVGASDRD